MLVLIIRKLLKLKKKILHRLVLAMDNSLLYGKSKWNSGVDVILIKITNWSQHSDSPDSKEICLKCRKWGFDSWVWKIPWRKEWLPLQYSCLENSMDRGAWGLRLWGTRVDTTEWLTFSLSILTITGQQRRDQDSMKSFFFLHLRKIFKDFSNFSLNSWGI